MNRFQDKNISVSYFENEIFVECPKCEKRAVITKDEPKSFLSQRTLKCLNCFYSQKGKKESYKVELNCYCSHCASELKVIIPDVNEKKELIAVKCSNCGETENYPPRNVEQQWMCQDIGKPSDGYFGLPLWLTESFRGNNFWALNYQHLEYLKEYISAELRERNGRVQWTLVEKLPDWMKSRKNRDKIVKLITDLERK
ncbi:MAG: hypothetical protein ABJK28_15930 [Algibacter sp.]